MIVTRVFPPPHSFSKIRDAPIPQEVHAPMGRKEEEEVGDLFITESKMMLKLLPSNKSATQPIRWFENGVVKNHQTAAKDIAALVERLRGKTRVVRGLTLMTDRGLRFDIAKSGLERAVEKAGFDVIN